VIARTFVDSTSGRVALKALATSAGGEQPRRTTQSTHLQDALDFFYTCRVVSYVRRRKSS